MAENRNGRSVMLAGIIVPVVLALCAGSVGWARSIAKEHEPRIRRLEDQGARIDERMKAMQKTLDAVHSEVKHGPTD